MNCIQSVKKDTNGGDQRIASLDWMIYFLVGSWEILKLICFVLRLTHEKANEFYVILLITSMYESLINF